MSPTKKILGLLITFLLIFCSVLGFSWIRQGASSQELLANYSKMMDYLQGFESLRGWPWWTPNFNLGHSLAESMGTILTYLLMLIGGGIFGNMIAGPKIIGIAFIFLSGLAMFLFVQRLQKNSWHAFTAAFLYAACPQFALRLAYNEHLVVAFCFIYPPLIFWTILNIAEKKRWRDILLLSLLYAGMTLTYVRTAAVFLPTMGIFAAWIFITQKKQRQNLLGGILKSALLFIPLGVFPLLPFLREGKWMTFFQLDPFRDWQMSFSMKTALSWLDRGGTLFTHMPHYFQADRGGFYLGMITFITFAILFLWNKKSQTWLQSPIGKQIRFFIGLGLFLNWLAYGPRSILVGHIEFLRNAQNISLWSIPVAWFLLYAQGFVIAKLWPKISLRHLWITLSLVIYFLIPGFLIIEKIPFYSQVRAPWFFWEVGGSFCLAIAVGLALPLILKDIFQSLFRRTLAAVLLFAICLMDFSIYYSYFTQRSLPQETFDDFKVTQEFLNEQKNPGKVFFASGRYFYLLTPIFTGRGLMLEAFHSHFTTSWTRQLLYAGSRDINTQRSQLNLTGISYIVLDKNDPDTPQQFQQHYRSLFPVVFENPSFAVLQNETSLAPAFLAKEFVAACPSQNIIKQAPQFLTLANFNYAVIEQKNIEMNQPNLAGVFDPAKENIEFQAGFEQKTGTPFQIHQAFQRKNYHEIHIAQLQGSAQSWLIIPESFHPDWQAYAHHAQIPVHKAFGSLLAVKIPENTDEIILKFTPPKWYSWILTASLIFWLIFLSLCATYFMSKK